MVYCNLHSALLFLSLVVQSSARSTLKSRRSIIATECNLPNEEAGYCVPFNSCTSLKHFDKSSEVFLRRWGCGPRDEDRSNPRVCCSRYNIHISNDITSDSLGFPVNCGRNYPKDSFPWIVKLLRQNDEGSTRFGCTGALIHPKVVLTAAHCLVSRQLESYGPLSGISAKKNRNSGFKDYSIAYTLPHPQYNLTNKYKDHNDVGLIFLKEEITHLTPICVLPRAEEPVEYTFVGWNHQLDLESSQLKIVTLVPFSWQQCYDKYERIKVTISVDQICAGGEFNKDTCSGDSGGPLMTVNDDNTWFAAGIVSYGVTCGKQGWPAIYTHLPNYIDWIKKSLYENRQL